MIDPVVSGGPMGMQNFVVCGAFFITREMPAAFGHVTMNEEAQSASWCLPASKTDPRALGNPRCGSASAGMRQE